MDLSTPVKELYGVGEKIEKLGIGYTIEENIDELITIIKLKPCLRLLAKL